MLVGHVYLTTTGPEPLTAMQAMMNGWEDVEVHAGHPGPDSEPGVEAEIGEAGNPAEAGLGTASAD